MWKLAAGKLSRSSGLSFLFHVCGLILNTPSWLLIPPPQVPSQISHMRILWKISRNATSLNKYPFLPLVHQELHPGLFVCWCLLVRFPLCCGSGASGTLPWMPLPSVYSWEKRVTKEWQRKLVGGSRLSQHSLSFFFYRFPLNSQAEVFMFTVVCRIIRGERTWDLAFLPTNYTSLINRNILLKDEYKRGNLMKPSTHIVS